MSEKEYKKPNITLNKIYTQNGDFGYTSLVGGMKLPKNHVRIRAYGEVDELNAIIGGCIEQVKKIPANLMEIEILSTPLRKIQQILFNLGNQLATPLENLQPESPGVRSSDIIYLESKIDQANKSLPVLRSFILPGGSEISTWFHLARTVCRRVERTVMELSLEEGIPPILLQYLNRLSDILFVWSRLINKLIGAEEIIWDPNAQ